MGYGGETAARDVPSPGTSLISDGEGLINRLQDLLHRMVKVGDHLHGSQPRDAGKPAQTVEPIATVRRNLDRAHQIISELESELTRIDTKL